MPGPVFSYRDVVMFGMEMQGSISGFSRIPSNIVVFRARFLEARHPCVVEIVWRKFTGDCGTWGQMPPCSRGAAFQMGDDFFSVGQPRPIMAIGKRFFENQTGTDGGFAGHGEKFAGFFEISSPNCPTTC